MTRSARSRSMTEPVSGSRRARHASRHAAHRLRPMIPIMPDDLYDRDALAWSEHQASLLRRVARGERVNEVDWEHVIEEIEDVGLSQLHAVESYLELMLRAPAQDQDLAGQRRRDVTGARSWSPSKAMPLRRFAPSMRQRLDGASAYRSAVRQVTLPECGGERPDCVAGRCPRSPSRQLLNERMYGAGAAALGGTVPRLQSTEPAGPQEIAASLSAA